MVDDVTLLTDTPNNEPEPPAPKVQRVVAVEELKDTVTGAISENFSTPVSSKYTSYIITSPKGVTPESNRALCPL